MPETTPAPPTHDDTRQPLLDELPFPRTGAANGTRLSRRLEILVGDRTLAHLMRPPLRPLVKRLPSLQKPRIDKTLISPPGWEF